MAIPKVSWKGKVYESYGDIDEKPITDRILQNEFDKKVIELDNLGGEYLIYIDFFGEIIKVEPV